MIESNIPFGTLISWIGICAYALLFYFILPSASKLPMVKRFKKLLFFNVIFATLWGVFSFFLSGNWAFTFENVNLFYLWITITALMVLMPVISVFILGIRASLLNKDKRT